MVAKDISKVLNVCLNLDFTDPMDAGFDEISQLIGGGHAFLVKPVN
jgi:hypothetical protein